MDLKKLVLVSLIAFGILELIIYWSAAGYLSNFLAYCCLFVIAAEGWNLLGGYIGEISFGHAAFFGVGAYVVGLPIGYGFGVPLPLLVLLGGLVVGLMALALSYPFLRITGFPFLIATFGLAIILERIFHRSDILFSTKGIFIPFIDPYLLYSVIGAVAIVSIVVSYLLVSSDLGLSLKATRDAPDAARMVGINTFRSKVIAFVIGAAMTGIAGAMFAFYSNFVHPTNCFGLEISLYILLGPYIGGIGTIIGPVVGTFVVIGLGETARTVFVYGHHLFVGIALVVIMLLMREGLYPVSRRHIERAAYKLGFKRIRR